MPMLRSVGLLGLLLAPAVASAIPTTITHQGRLLDAAGTPLSGPTSIAFSIYDAKSGGDLVWTDTVSVPVDDGTAGRSIVRGVPLVRDREVRFLEVFE